MPFGALNLATPAWRFSGGFRGVLGGFGSSRRGCRGPSAVCRLLVSAAQKAAKPTHIAFIFRESGFAEKGFNFVANGNWGLKKGAGVVELGRKEERWGVVERAR